MDTLPIEIYDEILKQLPKARSPYNTRLAQYSTINRKWQRIVERNIFHHICINSSELPLWRDVVESSLGACRRPAIQTVTFATDYAHRFDAEDSIDKAELSNNNMAFSRSIDDLFKLLGKWHSDTVTNDRMGHIQLVLEGSERSLRSAIEEANLSFSVGKDWSRQQAQFERVSRRDPVYLCYYGDSQAVPYISSFQLRSNHRIWPKSVMQLASRMENLTKFMGTFVDIEDQRITARWNHRKALGVNLHLLPESLQHLSLSMECNETPTGTFGQSAVSGKTDDLCIGLRKISRRLVELSLDEICISPALFWDEKDIDISSSPRLKSIRVGFSPVSSYGECFTLPDPNVEDEEENGRFTPDESLRRPLFNEPLLNELYISAGRAIHQMPSIEILELDMCGTQSAGGCRFGLYPPDATSKYSVLLYLGEKPFGVDDDVWKAWRIERKTVEIIPDSFMYYAEAVVPWKGGGG